MARTDSSHRSASTKTPPLYPKGNSPKTMRVIVLCLIVFIAALAAIRYFSNRKTVTTVTATGAAPQVLGGYGPEGEGGDPDLNRMKNRNTAPTEVVEYSVEKIIGMPHDILDQEGKRRRTTWYPASRLQAEKYESQGARVTGYLIRAKESGPESCNGYSDSLRDYHLWLSSTPDGDRSRSMIVEVTPRWRSVHPEWRLSNFVKLSNQHAQVRVTGWILWDEEHASEVEKSRGTQWEVHPITKFEVFTNGGWRDLTGEYASE